jgi:hypothetical protein
MAGVKAKGTIEVFSLKRGLHVVFDGSNHKLIVDHFTTKAEAQKFAKSLVRSIQPRLGKVDKQMTTAIENTGPVLTWPEDQRHEGCDSDADIKSIQDLVRVIGEAQTGYAEFWQALEATGSLLRNLGWKDGVGVQDEYGIVTHDEKDPYQLSWCAQEAVYLATGYGEIGGLNGGLQEADWSQPQAPKIDEALQYLLTNPRCQRTTLTEEQTVQLRESLEQAVHFQQHHFNPPMSQLHSFIHEKLGVDAANIALEGPGRISNDALDWLSDVRHEPAEYIRESNEWVKTAEITRIDNEKAANELVEFILEVQPVMKQRVAVTDVLFDHFHEQGLHGDELRDHVKTLLNVQFPFTA